MSKPDAPEPPDYAAQAVAQGEANVDAALATALLNRPNEITPYGTRTWTKSTPQTTPTAPGTGGGTFTIGPNGMPTWTPAASGVTGGTMVGDRVIPEYTVTTTLSPEQKRLYDTQTRISDQLGNIAEQGIGYVGQTANSRFDTSGLPGLSGGAGTQQASGLGATPGQINLSGPQAAPLNMSGPALSQLPSSADFAGQRDQITEALLSRARPDMNLQRNQLQTRLANQGITQGSEAYNREMELANRAENDMRTQALLAGSTEQQRLFENAMGIAQTGYEQDLTSRGFGNQAQNQAFQQGLAGLGFGNQAQQQAFQQGVTGTQLGNSAAAQNSQTALEVAKFGNQARSQGIQEQSFLRNEPLSLLNALRTGAQPTTPQFQNYYTGSQIQAAPIYQAAQDQYQAELDAFNAQGSGLLGGLVSLGGAALGSPWVGSALGFGAK